MSDTQHSCVIIGIAGASASGKSLIAQTIYEELVAELGAGQIGVITEDCYYRYQTHLTMEERVKTNYDHPNALDHDLLVQHLTQLVQGDAVNIPQYSYTEHTRLSDVTAKGLNLPDWMCGNAVGTTSNMKSSCPPRKSVIAGAEPL